MFVPEYAKFFDDSKNLFCVVDKNGLFLSVNKAFRIIFGYSEEDLLGRPFFDFLHPESQENARRIIGSLCPSKLFFSFQVRCRCKNGKYRTILWNLSLDAETQNFYAAGADITTVTERETLLNDALQIARVGGWQLDLATDEY